MRRKQKSPRRWIVDAGRLRSRLFEHVAVAGQFKVADHDAVAVNDHVHVDWG